MNILYLWYKDYPWDVRAEKICRSLVRGGHRVHLAARNLKRLPLRESVDGFHVHRLAPREGCFHNDTLSFPFFLNPLWTRLVERVITEEKIDLVMVRDLPLAVAGIRAARRHRIPAVFDMAEDYVAFLWDIWRYKKVLGKNLLVRNPLLARLVERYSLKRFDGVLVVTEETREVVRAAGGELSRVTIVGNTPPRALVSRPVGSAAEGVLRDRWAAIYTGGVTNRRGIDTVIDAIPAIVRDIPEFLFVILGTGYAIPRLQEMVSRRKLDSHVLWLGWVDHGRLFDYLSSCQAGVIPHYSTPHVNTTLPNKLFDYMARSLPVVASDAVPMRRIVEECRCGLNFRSRDSEDLSRVMVRIHRDPDDFGRNGREAVERKYHWEEDEKRLLDAVDRAAGRKAGP